MTKLREALATATTEPGKGTQGGKPAKRESAVEKEKGTVPENEDIPHSLESDSLTSAQKGGARKPATLRGQEGEAMTGSGCVSR